MEQKKNPNLRVVKQSESAARQLEKRIKKYKTKFRKRVIIVILSVLLIILGAALLVLSQTYTKGNVIRTYTGSNLTDSHYVQFGKNILKYNSDGVALINQSGKELWNQSSQFKTPMVAKADDSIVVADNGGTSIQVFDKSGLKGELTTNLPIEKVAVSNQGVVAALLKNELTPEIICYDATGNILVEHKISLAKSGYPVSISLSKNGYILMASYLSIADSNVGTKIVYYNFDSVGEDKTDHQVTSADMKGEIYPTTFFMSDSVSVAIGEHTLRYYNGEQIPEQSKEIAIKKEIISVAYSNKYVALLLQNNGKKGYELRVYNQKGAQVSTSTVTGTYSHMKLSGREVILYDGNACEIFTTSGHQKFVGQLDVTIEEMFAISGVNKYVVMNTKGMDIVRLMK